MGIQGALCPAKIPVPAASALLHCAGEALLPISRGRRCSSYESVNGPVLQIFFSPIFYFFSLFFCLFPSGWHLLDLVFCCWCVFCTPPPWAGFFTCRERKARKTRPVPRLLGPRAQTLLGSSPWCWSRPPPWRASSQPCARLGRAPVS